MQGNIHNLAILLTIKLAIVAITQLMFLFQCKLYVLLLFWVMVTSTSASISNSLDQPENL